MSIDMPQWSCSLPISKMVLTAALWLRTHSTLADAYLSLAEAVLAREARPLTPAEILQQAYLEGAVPWHLRGRTQHKTLHARLSEDISKNPEKSRFVRTGPGRFFLRTLLSASPSNDHLRIYLAPPRRKELRRELILCLEDYRHDDSRTSQIISKSHIDKRFLNGRYSYHHWGDIKRSSRLIPIYSFLIVHRDEHVLAYRVGKFRPDSDPMRGLRSIGFGGAVLSSDADLLYNSWFGIVENAISELILGLGMPPPV